jgi:hypothetical protein
MFNTAAMNSNQESPEDCVGQDRSRRTARMSGDSNSAGMERKRRSQSEWRIFILP